MNIEVYSRIDPPCPYCIKAKKRLIDDGLDYVEKRIGIDMSKEDAVREIMERAGVELRTVPAIFIDGDFIGGCDELFEILDSKVDVSDVDLGDLEI